MLPSSRESRPAGGTTEPAQSISTAIKITPSVREGTDNLGDLDARGQRLQGKLVVQVEIDDEHYRTVVYQTVKAAENAVRRANERGKRAHVTLCQLLPIGVVAVSGGGHR